MRHLFVVDSLDKQIQNEKELIHLASAGGLRGVAILYLCGEYKLDLTWRGAQRISIADTPMPVEANRVY